MPAAGLLLSVLLLQADTTLPLVLRATGEVRDGLAVVERHPDPAPYLRVLTTGYTRRLLQLYTLEQRFAHPDRPPQPAVLVLSENEGGFPRWGLHLDGPHPSMAYVDLHRRSQPAGRFGAIDQIFPHELLHIIVTDLAGRPPRGRATQVHAIGVKTDRITAFAEGFAEHAQVMAIEAGDAVPETHRLGPDAVAREAAFHAFEDYRAALAARITVAPRARMTFPLWFSRSEQVLRYHGVRDNLFAREPDVPRRLYTNARWFDAYLLENTLPGGADAEPKGLERLLATEGVISSLFVRIMADPQLQRVYREASFYAQFGTTREAVDPVENVYLKVFAAIRAGGYDTAEVLAAYGRLFPDERIALERVAAGVLFDPSPVSAPELWVLNGYARTGTSLFDQFRGIPRALAFDLNAASLADLVSVPGVDLALAGRIRAAAPFASIDELERVPGIDSAIADRFREMRQAMLTPPPTGVSAEGGLTFRAVLLPYARRAAAVWLVCSAIGAALYRAVRRVAWWRALLNGLAAAAVALLAGWTVGSGGGFAAVVAPLAVFGVPGALVRMLRARSFRAGGPVLAAWAVAACAAAIAVVPLG